MAPNTSIATPPGRFLVAVESELLDLMEGLGLEADAFSELVGLVASVPADRRVELVQTLYNELAEPAAGPDDACF